MGVKEQFEVLKKNWLLIAFILIVVVVISGGSDIISQNFAGYDALSSKSYGAGYAEVALDYGEGYYISPTSVSDFAPEVEDRKITKTSSLSTEIERGNFKEAEEKLKNVVTGSGAYLLNERVNRNGEGWKGYYYGYYSLKVDVNKYDAVVAQLKEIGEVQSFNENAVDVTGSYENLEIEIAVEKERLANYEEMYEEAGSVEWRLELTDRIYDEERTIKYLEDRLENLDNRVVYSTISFSMTEETSEWTNIVFVGVSDLVKSFVGSLNSLLKFLFGVLPWAVLAFVVWWAWKKWKK